MPTIARMPKFDCNVSEIASVINRYNYYDSVAPNFGIEPHDEPDGVLPVYHTKLNDALGLTAFSEDRKPVYVAISKDIPEDKLPRVCAHELDHIKSSILIKYMDLPEPWSEILIEGYPEFRRYNYWKKLGELENAKNVIRESPYKEALFLANLIDQYYVGKEGVGYRAFIKDIKREKSVRKVFKRFIEQYKSKAN